MPDYGPSGDSTLARRVRERRNALGYSQADLGLRLDPPMSQGWVSAIERAERGTTPDMLRELARVLETTISYLIGESTDARSPGSRIREHGIGYDVLKRIPEERWRLFADFLDTIVEDENRDDRAEQATRDSDLDTGRGSPPARGGVQG